MRIQDLIGLSTENAVNRCVASGKKYRIAGEDGESRIFPAILWNGVQLTIEKGIVVTAEGKGNVTTL